MSDDRWWVEAQERAWGPYPAARLPQFVGEGRLGPGSRMGRSEAGPFTPAAELPELAGLFSPARTATTPAALPAARPAEQAGEAGAPDLDSGAVQDGGQVENTGSRALLVLSDAPEADLPALETALRTHGEIARIRPGLWLLRAETTPALLRNALSRGLRGGAMLLVVEAPLADSAWFALEGETDRALRRLWTGR